MSDDVERIAAGYDLVYDAIVRSSTFDAIWREHSLGPDYPAGFEHISFVTLAEMRAMTAALALDADSTLVDLACGMGGPGLWIARETGAQIIGIDVSVVALKHARIRAERVGMADRARYDAGAFAATGLPDASADAAMTVDALQYAPDKRTALAEVARILKPGGRIAFACFEVDPAKVAGVPIFGTNPVSYYAPLLDAAGFEVLTYNESDGWHARVMGTYQAIVDAGAALTTEMGAAAYTALRGECALTLQLLPYPRRVIFTAIRR